MTGQGGFRASPASWISASWWRRADRKASGHGGLYRGSSFTPWSGPVVRGVWNDIKLHVKWSASDDVGFIEFWLNGAPQKFAAAPCPGQTRCMERTLMPGGGGVYFKQGYYRDPAIAATGVVYHDGFSEADSEAGLAP
jgi:hypothetical protein